MAIRFDDRVAIVTGGGGGLGRAYALALAARGARVIVNDPGGASDGSGASDAAAAVVDEIVAAGGVAAANRASVTDEAGVAEMVTEAEARWGAVDILINNAGILRDKSFAKMSGAEFRDVLDVHLVGSFNCTRAVWDGMRARNYGRVLMTISSSGLYGNFGQANYAAAKMGLVGLAKTLALEGGRHDIRVNSLAPTAATRMTEALFPTAMLERFSPESVVPAALFLVSADAPNGAILGAGAGAVQAAHVTLTTGAALADQSPESVADAWTSITERAGETVPRSGSEQALGILKLLG